MFSDKDDIVLLKWATIYVTVRFCWIYGLVVLEIIVEILVSLLFIEVVFNVVFNDELPIVEFSEEFDVKLYVVFEVTFTVELEVIFNED